MSVEKQSKGYREEFAKFFESPTRETLRQLLANDTGEYDDIDFKGGWIDTSTLATHILGMANKFGGAIIFGVDEIENNKFDPIGIDLNDKTEFTRDVNKYIPHNNLKYLVLDFHYEESEYPKIKGRSFRVVIVNYDAKYIPFLATKDGKNISKTIVYIRKNVSTVPAEYTDLQDILNRRLETGFSSAREISLQEHFEELKLMYSLISKGQYINVFAQNTIADSSIVKFVRNIKYPQEDFEDFVIRMIDLKKEIIQSIVKTERYTK